MNKFQTEFQKDQWLTKEQLEHLLEVVKASYDKGGAAYEYNKKLVRSVSLPGGVCSVDVIETLHDMLSLSGLDIVEFTRFKDTVVKIYNDAVSYLKANEKYKLLANLINDLKRDLDTINKAVYYEDIEGSKGIRLFRVIIDINQMIDQKMLSEEEIKALSEILH